MRTWTAAPPKAGWTCGLCGHAIADLDPVQLLTLPGVDDFASRHARRRCVGCAVGQPDLEAIDGARRLHEGEGDADQKPVPAGSSSANQRSSRVPAKKPRAFASIGELLDHKVAAANDRDE
jgi:hypothetical protein